MQRPDWMLDELAYAGEEHLDPEYIAVYDRKAGFDPTEDLDVLRGLRLNETSVVVDLGVGTGTFAMAVAPFCERVVAVDVSSAMLTALREKVGQAGLANVETAHAGFLTYEHKGEKADIVYSRNALHHLPDFWKAVALTRVADMLKPGGILLLHDLVYSFEPREVETAFEAWLSNARATPEEGWTRPELETHIREEYSTFSWLLEPLLERTGFEIRDASFRGPGTYARYTCLKRP